MHLKTVPTAVCAGLMACWAAGCGGSSSKAPAAPAQAKAPQRISLTSTAFAPNATIPRAFTCDGKGSSPPLAWSKVPGQTQELALLAQDPNAPGGAYTHWLVYRLSPDTRAFPGGTPPSTAYEGRNSAGKPGWTPPCPPKGAKPHHYVFTLLALSKPVGLPPGATAADLSATTAGAVIGQGGLVGVYSR